MLKGLSGFRFPERKTRPWPLGRENKGAVRRLWKSGKEKDILWGEKKGARDKEKKRGTDASFPQRWGNLWPFQREKGRGLRSHGDSFFFGNFFFQGRNDF